MAAESDGQDMEMREIENDEDQPMDLSRGTKEPCSNQGPPKHRPLPQLIPISFLQSPYRLQRAYSENSANDVERDAVECLARFASVKRQQRQTKDEGSWCSKRLLRYRSVPHLSPHSSILQRQKSRSESRIPSASELVTMVSEPSVVTLGPGWSGVIKNYRSTDSVNNAESGDEQLRRDFAAATVIAGGSKEDSSWPYFGSYHTRVVNGAQQHTAADITECLQCGDDCKCGQTRLRARLRRPMTGRHVRSGTGASAATLQSLRLMLQRRNTNFATSQDQKNDST